MGFITDSLRIEVKKIAEADDSHRARLTAEMVSDFNAHLPEIVKNIRLSVEKDYRDDQGRTPIRRVECFYTDWFTSDNCSSRYKLVEEAALKQVTKNLLEALKAEEPRTESVLLHCNYERREPGYTNRYDTWMCQVRVHPVVTFNPPLT